VTRRGLLIGAAAVAVTAATGYGMLPQQRTDEGANDVNGFETGLIGNKIPFIRGGTGPRRAVIFFGGNALFKRLDKSSDPGRYASQVAKLLPPDFTFWILGYEESPPEEGYTLDTIVRDLEGAVRSGIGKPDLVMGISFGGFVAQRFAASHPDLVDRLVIMISAHRFSEGGWSVMERQFRSLENGDFYELVKDNALLFRRPWYNWLVQLKLWKDRDRLASEYKDPKAILRDYRSIFSKDFTRNAEFARRIKAETLLIGGTADQYFDVQAFKETAGMIPGARLKLYEGETHMLPIERSGDIASDMADFLKAADVGQPMGQG